MIELGDGVIQLGVDQLQRMMGREPPAKTLARFAPDSLQSGARLSARRRFEQKDDVLCELVQLRPTIVQIGDAATECLLCHRLRAERRDEWFDGAFDEVLI